APWLPELPHSVALGELGSHGVEPEGSEPSAPGPPDGGRGLGGLRLALGLVDAPDEQAQYPAVVDLGSSGGLVVVGRGGTGKTTVLETLASATLTQGGADEPPAVVFALDFASRRLTSLAALPHCAIVGTGDDLEAVTRIIVVLGEEVARRRAIADRGDGVRAAETLPPLLLLIDDYGSVVQAFEGAGAPSGHHQWLERLNRIIVDGRQVGLATALTATRRAEIRSSLWATLGERLVLGCVDDAAYRDVGVDPALLGPEPPPGRGVLGTERVVQWALPSSTTPPDRQQVPERLRVGPLPDDLPLLPATAPGSVGPQASLRVPLGVVDLRAEPFEVDLGLDDLTVIGPPRSGRSTTLAAVVVGLAASGQSVLAAGSSRSSLSSLSGISGWFPIDVRAPDALAGLADAVDASAELRPVVVIDGVDLLDDPMFEPASARIAAAGLPLVARPPG
ncbi:MAG: FtsK/SpoIIIE domain-containing protein, partial [Actinomycetota bacterium]